MRLVLISNGDRMVPRGEAKVFALEEGSNLIGRWDPDSGACPEIDLEDYDDDAKVSRKHAMIYVTGGVAFLEDMGSLNGTYLDNGERLTAGDRIELKEGTEIILGKTRLRFE